MHVKTGDEVIITTGKDKWFTGEVLEVDRDNNRVKVEDCNVVVKHKQPDQFRDEPGERVYEENWIDASNVALFLEEEDEEGDVLVEPVRVGYRYVGEDGELFADKNRAKESFSDELPTVVEKVRIARQTGDVLDPMPSY